MKSVSGKRSCGVFEEHGWTLDRVRGSHHIYAQPGNPIILTVPVHGHRDLRKGTLMKLLKDSGLEEADFWQEAKRVGPDERPVAKIPNFAECVFEPARRL